MSLRQPATSVPRWPMHATSTGKACLAYDKRRLDDMPAELPTFTARTLASRDRLTPQVSGIRRRGYAETVDELEEGFTAVATVLRGPLGDVEGALSIGGPTQRLGAARRAELGATLCQGGNAAGAVLLRDGGEAGGKRSCVVDWRIDMPAG